MATDVLKLDGNFTNEKLLGILNNSLNTITNDRAAEQLAQVDIDSVVDIGQGKYIKKENEEQYNALQELIQFFNFQDQPADELYDIPELEIKGNDGPIKLRLTIPKDAAKKIADKAEKLEALFKDTLGIKFPTEIYQLQSKYSGQNLPGKDFPAPEPKLASETPSEYEERIEKHYKNYGEDKTLDNETKQRNPYTHEKIDYQKGNEITEGFISPAYHLHVAEGLKETIGKGQGQKKNNPIKKGEKQKVTFSELAKDDQNLGSNFGHRLKTWKHMLKNPDGKRHLGYAIAVVAAGGALVLAATAHPPLTAGVIAVGLVVGGTIKWGTPFIRKMVNKINDLIYGEKIKEEPEKGEEEEKTKQPQPTPGQKPTKGDPKPTSNGGQSNPTPGTSGGATPQQNDSNSFSNVIDFLSDMGADMTDIQATETRIENLKQEMIGLSKESDEYRTKQEELIALTNQQRAHLMNISDAIRGFVQENKIEQSTGGKSK